MAERVMTLRISVENTQAVNALNQFNNALRTTGTSQQQAITGLSGLNASLLNLNAGLNVAMVSFNAFSRAMDIIGDVNELGQSVNIARKTFEALAGGTEEAADMLELMQEKTGGVVDNLSLMNGASRLLQMGLADSKEEVAGLTEMAIKLGGALGMDTNKAIEDFSLLLSNMSFLRLDQFGISAGAVRARVEELKEEFPEMTREARFAMAVLEEGQGAMQDLGTALNASSTAVDRFNTKITNLAQQGAANVNFAIEQALRLVEVLGEQADLTTLETINDYYRSHGMQGYGGTGAVFDSIEAVNERIANLLNEQNVELMRMNLAQQSLLTAADRRAGAEERAAAAAEDAAYAQLRMGALGDLHTQMMEASAGLFRQTGFEGETFEPVQRFATDEDAHRLEQQAHWAEQQVEYMRDLKNAMDEAVFTDEQIDEAELYADQIRGMADEARRMSDALKDASLSELFGQTSGGRQGEMSDMVIEEMRAAGRTEEEIAAAQDVFDASTGRSTAASTNMENLAPILAGMDPATAAIAMQNLDEVLTTLAGAGFDINNLTPEQFMNAAGMVQLGDGAPNITIVAAGDTLSGIAMEGGTTVADILRNNPSITNPNLIHPGDEIAMGPAAPGAEMLAGFDSDAFAQGLLDGQGATSLMAEDMEAVADKGDRFAGATGEMAGKMSAARGEVDGIATAMTELTSKEQMVKLKFVVDASAIRLAINDALGQFNLNRGVVDTGGMVPGAVARGRPS